MRRENEGKTTSRAFCWEGTDFAAAPRAKISAVRRLRMTSTKRWERIHRVRGKPHHQQRIDSRLFRMNCRRCGHLHHKLVEMLLVEGDIVRRLIVCFCTELSTYSYLRRKPNNPNLDFVCN